MNTADYAALLTALDAALDAAWKRRADYATERCAADYDTREWMEADHKETVAAREYDALKAAKRCTLAMRANASAAEIVEHVLDR